MSRPTPVKRLKAFHAETGAVGRSRDDILRAALASLAKHGYSHGDILRAWKRRPRRVPLQKKRGLNDEMHLRNMALYVLHGSGDRWAAKWVAGGLPGHSQSFEATCDRLRSKFRNKRESLLAEARQQMEFARRALSGELGPIETPTGRIYHGPYLEQVTGGYLNWATVEWQLAELPAAIRQAVRAGRLKPPPGLDAKKLG